MFVNNFIFLSFPSFIINIAITAGIVKNMKFSIAFAMNRMAFIWHQQQKSIFMHIKIIQLINGLMNTVHPWLNISDKKKSLWDNISYTRQLIIQDPYINTRLVLIFFIKNRPPGLDFWFFAKLFSNMFQNKHFLY